LRFDIYNDDYVSGTHNNGVNHHVNRNDYHDKRIVNDINRRDF
jgi:hypothetical protein